MERLNTYEEVSDAFDELFPICRSILGQGYRDSMKILQRYIPLEEEMFFSGEKVLNWTVPQEWVIREAWIKDEQGNIIVDFKENNLQVLNYSEAIDKVMDLEELKKCIYTSRNDENAIPYTFSYYKKRWGFCMSKRHLEQLKPGKYHAYIDSEFVDGRLVVGQTVLSGKTKKEIFLSSYLCHPSMANNELSGPLVLAMLYQRIKRWKNRKYTYRFVVNPETIGSISYLSRYGEMMKKDLEAGLVLTCLGGEMPLNYKTSRSQVSPFDLLVDKMNSEAQQTFRVTMFNPAEGSDERQYCSPGFDLPVSQMSRMTYGDYKEYHTSLDTKELMGIDCIIDSCDKIEAFLLRYEEESDELHKRACEKSEVYEALLQKEMCDLTKKKTYYKNLFPYGEVKLGDYELYPSINSCGERKDEQSILNQSWFVESVMMILNYSDGKHSLGYCAQRLDRSEEEIREVAEILISKGLLAVV